MAGPAIQPKIFRDRPTCPKLVGEPRTGQGTLPRGHRSGYLDDQSPPRRRAGPILVGTAHRREYLAPVTPGWGGRERHWDIGGLDFVYPPILPRVAPRF